ncbi:MAG: multidrug effflux MFS transporter, partial [Limnobacter sp.]|nr:multidrug effflux MFS transporter [Limnobacter sp.]
PVVTLMVLDLHPTRRGMASSLQSCVASIANGLVSGLIAPLVMGSTVAMSATALAMLVIGLGAWLYLRRHSPETVRYDG